MAICLCVVRRASRITPEYAQGFDCRTGLDCEAYVEDCVRSVLKQSESDIQVLAVDDGSTDATLSILKKLALSDSRLQVESHWPNSGYPGFARNRGIARATGKYLAFLDGDDLYHPEKIRRTLSVFEAFPETDVVFHDVTRFKEELHHDDDRSFLRTSHFMERAANCMGTAGDAVYLCDTSLYIFASLQFVPCHTSAIVVRKDAVLSEPVWFPEGRHGEDGDLWLRLLKDRHFAFVNDVLSYYRQRPGNITSDQLKYLGGAVRIHKDNLERGKGLFSNDERRLYRAKIARILSDLGYAYFCKLRSSEARQAYGESLATDFRLDTFLAYLKTFAPQPVVKKYRQRTERLGR